MKLELENINNLVVDDLDLRNRNWTTIDDSLELKADKTYVDTQLSEKADLSEIEGARGTEATLGARLDSTDAQLNETANNLVEHKLDYTSHKEEFIRLVDSLFIEENVLWEVE